jgi:hypothetical protein
LLSRCRGRGRGRGRRRRRRRRLAEGRARVPSLVACRQLLLSLWQQQQAVLHVRLAALDVYYTLVLSQHAHTRARMHAALPLSVYIPTLATVMGHRDRHVPPAAFEFSTFHRRGRGRFQFLPTSSFRKGPFILDYRGPPLATSVPRTCRR